jgi:tetratricopeptide (TPR) repeat protein
LERRQGRWQEALTYIRQSVQLDPRNAINTWEVGDALRDMRRYGEAVVAFRHAAELAPDNLNLASEAPALAVYERGSTYELEAWLNSPKPATANATQLLAFKRELARARGDWAQLVEFNRQHPYLDPFDDPHWAHDVQVVGDLISHDELAAARTRARQLLPELIALTEKQPTNALLWQSLAFLHAYTDDRDSALRCARRMKELVPESVDAKEGPRFSRAYAQVLAWTGDKDGALAEFARLLCTPRGDNVYFARLDVGWRPLHDEPRFHALLADPKNNEPLLMK